VRCVEDDGRHDRLHCVAVTPERISSNVWAKFDSALRQELLVNRPAEFAVLIVLAPGANHPSGPAVMPGEAADEIRRAFGRRAQAVVGTLFASGGRDIRELWLTETVAARISLPTLLAVADRPEVRQILLNSSRQAETAAEH
jgi:hypothetical protein